jgi:hypothetical protein
MLHRASLEDLADNPFAERNDSHVVDVEPAPPKEKQYFLSHKKSHSKMGFVPAQIARNLHDSLELLGHSGWFDVDNLSKVTREQLRKEISTCASMIVLFNDETSTSEWVNFEWQCAQALGIPIKVVIDLECCTKRIALEQLSTNYPWMLKYQLLEHSERTGVTPSLHSRSSFLRDEIGNVGTLTTSRPGKNSSVVADDFVLSDGLFEAIVSSTSPPATS